MKVGYRTTLLGGLLMLALMIAIVPAAQAGWAQDQAASKSFAGKISAVDAGKGTIEVKDQTDKGMTFTVDSKTSITKDGKAVPLTDLKAGTQVNIEYTESGGSMMAKSIVVHATKG